MPLKSNLRSNQPKRRRHISFVKPGEPSNLAHLGKLTRIAENENDNDNDVIRPVCFTGVEAPAAASLALVDWNKFVRTKTDIHTDLRLCLKR